MLPATVLSTSAKPREKICHVTGDSQILKLQISDIPRGDFSSLRCNVIVANAIPNRLTTQEMTLRAKSRAIECKNAPIGIIIINYQKVRQMDDYRIRLRDMENMTIC